MVINIKEEKLKMEPSGVKRANAGSERTQMVSVEIHSRLLCLFVKRDRGRPRLPYPQSAPDRSGFNPTFCQ